MNYRLLHVSVSRGLADRAEEALEEAGLEAGRFDGDDSVLFVAYGAGEEVEDASSRLRDAGLGERGFMSISAMEAVVSEEVERASAEEEEGEEGESERVAREELIADAESMATLSNSYLVLTAISSVIATAGLLADSTAVVIGSMVIAPLIGPAMASSIGTVTGRADIFSRGILAEVVGLMTAIISSAVFATVVFSFIKVPPLELLSLAQVSERAYPDLMSVAVAVGAGIAGALSLTTGLSSALVGVMIAVALIPPAAAAGIGLALGDPVVTLGSTVLLLVNVFSIDLAGTLTFRYQGYVPEGFFEQVRSKKSTMWRVGFMFSLLLFLSSLLAMVTYFSYTNSAMERSLHETLTGPASPLAEEGVELRSVDVNYRTEAFGLRRVPSEVVVTVWAAEPPPAGFGEDISVVVDETAGRDLRLVLEVQDVRVVG